MATHGVVLQRHGACVKVSLRVCLTDDVNLSPLITHSTRSVNGYTKHADLTRRGGGGLMRHDTWECWDLSLGSRISPVDEHCAPPSLLVPAVRLLTVGSRVFTVVGPRDWNTLPEETTSAPPLTIFWLFRQSYHLILSSDPTSCLTLK